MSGYREMWAIIIIEDHHNANLWDFCEAFLPLMIFIFNKWKISEDPVIIATMMSIF